MRFILHKTRNSEEYVLDFDEVLARGRGSQPSSDKDEEGIYGCPMFSLITRATNMPSVMGAGLLSYLRIFPFSNTTPQKVIGCLRHPSVVKQGGRVLLPVIAQSYSKAEIIACTDFDSEATAPGPEAYQT
jgi:hypothetical protein